MNAYMNQYQNNDILTASPEKILILLFDGVIRFVRQGKLAIDEGRIEDKVTAISKALAIVTEFSNTLDREVGGEIAVDLSRLYDFMIRELTTANLKNNSAKLEPVLTILLDLREGFAGAAEVNRQQQEKRHGQSTQPSEHVAVSF